MPVDHTGALANDDIAIERDDHEVAGCPKIRREAIWIDRLVKDVGRYTREHARIAGVESFESKGHTMTPERGVTENSDQTCDHRTAPDNKSYRGQKPRT